MIKEGDMLWLYRPRIFNNYQGLSEIVDNVYRKKSLLYMHQSFFEIIYQPMQYCCYQVKRD